MLADTDTAPAPASTILEDEPCIVALLDARLCAFELEFGRLNPLLGIAVAQHAMAGISGAQFEAIGAWAGAVASLMAQTTGDLAALNDRLRAAL